MRHISSAENIIEHSNKDRKVIAKKVNEVTLLNLYDFFKLNFLGCNGQQQARSLTNRQSSWALETKTKWRRINFGAGEKATQERSTWHVATNGYHLTRPVIHLSTLNWRSVPSRIPLTHTIHISDHILLYNHPPKPEFLITLAASNSWQQSVLSSAANAAMAKSVSKRQQ